MGCNWRGINAEKRFNFLTLLLACACTAVITLAVIMALVQKAAGSSTGGMVFLKTLVTVRDNYVEPVDDESCLTVLLPAWLRLWAIRIPLTLTRKASAKLLI